MCIFAANAPITIGAIFALNGSFVSGRDRVMNAVAQGKQMNNETGND